MHVTTQRRHYTGKDGRERVYETHLLRRSWREGGKVRNETVANLSKLPGETIELIRRSLAGERFVPAGQQAQVARSLPHGHAAAVHAMARKLGFPALLGPPGPERDLAYALIISRVLRPASKLATLAGGGGDVTLGAGPGRGRCLHRRHLRRDGLAARPGRTASRRQLAARHLDQGGIAMFDLSSSWVEGAALRAGRVRVLPGRQAGPQAQIEYGLLTDPDGRPVAVRVVRREHRRPVHVPRDRHRGAGAASPWSR